MLFFRAIKKPFSINTLRGFLFILSDKKGQKRGRILKFYFI
nr:MAG TPA: hypothetical protein [Caudoviricetes sp.]